MTNIAQKLAACACVLSLAAAGCGGSSQEAEKTTTPATDNAAANTAGSEGSHNTGATDEKAQQAVAEPAPAPVEPAPAAEPAAPAKKDIVATAAEAGSFKTLLSALDAAGLTDTLKGEGPFTVFAPSDEAFAKLKKGQLESLLKPANKEKLKALLSHHVVQGNAILSKDVGSFKSPKTLAGKPLTITASKDGKVVVNHATVVKADIEASNGVIHVIDKVLQH